MKATTMAYEMVWNGTQSLSKSHSYKQMASSVCSLNVIEKHSQRLNMVRYRYNTGRTTEIPPNPS